MNSLECVWDFANYLVNVMLEERRADDIRIGHLDGFLDAQFGKAMAHFLPMYLGFARFSAVTDGKNALLSLLSNFTAYLLIGAQIGVHVEMEPRSLQFCRQFFSFLRRRRRYRCRLLQTAHWAVCQLS